MKSFKSAKHRRLLYRFARELNICEIQLQRFVRWLTNENLMKLNHKRRQIKLEYFQSEPELHVWR